MIRLSKNNQTTNYRLGPLLFLFVCSFFLNYNDVVGVVQANIIGGEVQFLELQQKLQFDVLELRHVVEQAYENRCDPYILRQCQRGNYHTCDSAFPNPSCPAGDAFRFDACAGPGGGDASSDADGDDNDNPSSCGTRWDFSVSTVRFPPASSSFSFSSAASSYSINHNHRLDPAVIEDICFSQQLDEYFIAKYKTDEPYWAQWGIDSPWMHFGAASGAFRIYPARPQQEDGCDQYDPRLRPWYVAGSSGPKNVVLVLDTSGSMEGLRLLYLKQAAIRIVDSLTIGDRVALVSFSNTARDERIEGRSLVKVTASTKRILKERINALEAAGSTNIYDAFRRSFQVMEEAIPLELVVPCNTALLFLTDGEMTDPPHVNETTVLEFVQQGLAQLEERLSQPIYLYTFSVSENGDVHHFPKQLACGASTNGIWSQLVDDRSIVESLASYTNLFSIGLGEGRNDDFTAWVEPYTFATNGVKGVTVSAPAFDRSVEPPKLIGVVGIDLPMSALDRALGVELGSSQTLDRVVQASTAKCPRLEISACQMEDFRALGLAGEEARCGNIDCTTTVSGVVPKDGSNNRSLIVGDENQASSCHNPEYLPTDVLANRDHQYAPFVERACCNPDAVAVFKGGPINDTCIPRETFMATSTTSKSVTSEPGLVAAMVVLAVLVLGGGIWWWRFRTHHGQSGGQAVDTPVVVATSLHVVQPPKPSAPMANSQS